MKLRRSKTLSGIVAVMLAAGALFEFTTHMGRGWWRSEAFYQNRPTSWWSAELEAWRFTPFA